MAIMQTLTLGIVPSWLAEIVTRHPTASYKDLLDFSSLDGLEGDSSILTRDELIIYILAQGLQPSLMKGAFTDIHNIALSEANRNFCATFKSELNRLQKELETRSRVDALLRDHDNNMSHYIAEGGSPLTNEYYVPVVVDQNTLFLIGSPEPAYKDDRAFYNAVLEQLATITEFTEFKQSLVFKQYLRHAVSDR
jgi:hypothetical protein